MDGVQPQIGSKVKKFALSGTWIPSKRNDPLADIAAATWQESSWFNIRLLYDILVNGYVKLSKEGYISRKKRWLTHVEKEKRQQMMREAIDYLDTNLTETEFTDLNLDLNKVPRRAIKGK